MTTVVGRRDLRADAGGMRLAILSSGTRSWMRIIEEKMEPRIAPLLSFVFTLRLTIKGDFPPGNGHQCESKGGNTSCESIKRRDSFVGFVPFSNFRTRILRG
jgi:hypothetical protein